MKDHIKRLIDKKISELPKSNHHTYEGKKKIKFPKWWPKALDVNNWGDTPDRRIDQLVTAAALIHQEIERLETMRSKKEYELWVEGVNPVFIGTSIGQDFDEAVQNFISTTGNSHHIEKVTPFRFNSRKEWNDRKSNWHISDLRLFESKKEAICVVEL